MKKHYLFISIALVLAIVGLNYWTNATYYLTLLRLSYQGRQFRQTYKYATLDIPFHPEMSPRLDVYLPRPDAPPPKAGYPVLIFVHGGSWDSFHKEDFTPVAMQLLPKQMVVVIPDYTLYPEARYEQMTNEVAAAIGWTLENIQQYGGDPKRVVVAGHSAGGHLVAMAILNPQFLRRYGHEATELKGWVGVSGVYNIEAQYKVELAKGKDGQPMATVMGGQANFATASPSTYVQPHLPRMLLLHGGDDQTVQVEMAINFQAKLQAAEADSELKIHPQVGHIDFLLQAALGQPSPMVDDLCAFVLDDQ